MDAPIRERHPSLAAWLVILALANGFLTIMYGLMWVSLLIIKISANSTAAVGLFLPTLAVTSLAALIFIFAIYKWKKWGLFGFALTTVISFAINMKIGMNNLMALLSLLGITVLVYLIRPYWDSMDTF